MSIANASPWARNDDELLIISTTNYFSADLVQENQVYGTYESLDNNTYLEFGLTDEITIGGKAIYGTSWLNTGIGSLTDSGFSEVEGYAQYEVLRTNENAASFKLSAGKPAAFQSTARAALGSGGADAELAILYGHNIIFRPVKLFAAAEVGYRKRFGNAADVVRLQATLGIEPTKRWVVLLEGFGTISLRNEMLGGADYDIIKLQPSVVYRLNHHWAIQVGASKDLATRNLAPGKSFFIGLWSAF